MKNLLLLASMLGTICLAIISILLVLEVISMDDTKEITYKIMAVIAILTAASVAIHHLGKGGGKSKP